MFCWEYIYYILYIYIKINFAQCIMWKTLAKRYNNSQLVSAVAVFKGHNSEYDSQQDIMSFGISWIMYVRFLFHMQKDKSKVNIGGTG